jgi:hypothetical protein
MYDSGSDCEYAVGRENDKPQITTRFATSDDVLEYWGKPHPGTLRAIVAVQDGKVTGIIGVVREGPVGKYFCDIKPELEPYLTSMPIMRAIKQSMKFVEAYRGPLISVAEHAEGCRILNRLGFTHLDGALYGWLR